MADKLPLVISTGEIEQLQPGDVLINQEGTVVYAAAAFATDNVLLRADGTGFGSQASSLSATDLGQLVFGQSPFNVIIGTSATGDAITTGVDNMLIGGFAGSNIEDGIRNMCIGGSAGGLIVSGDGNACVGFGSLFFCTADDNVAIGNLAGFRTTTGTGNVFIGSHAGEKSGSQSATASNSIAIGEDSFTTASNQAVLGNSLITETILRGAVKLASTSTEEASGAHLPILEISDSTGATYIDVTAFTNASANFAMGRDAGANITTATNCMLIGTGAGANITTGFNNTCIGGSAGAAFDTGAGNTAIGSKACLNTTSGARNLAIGGNALRGLTTGSDNTAIGTTAGDSLTTGSDNIHIGSGAGDTASQSGTVGNTIGIGKGVTTSSNNEIVIGNSSHDKARITGILEVTSEPSVADQLWDDNGVQRISDGTTRPWFYEGYASGTAYTLTTTPAAVAFGTTNPTITLATIAGTYRVSGFVTVEYNGATFAANQAATFTLRRTNNTAANLTDGTTVYTMDIVTTATRTVATIYWEASIYTAANTSDVLTIFGDIAVLPSAGSVQVTAAFIKAERLRK